MAQRFQQSTPFFSELSDSPSSDVQGTAISGATKQGSPIVGTAFPIDFNTQLEVLEGKYLTTKFGLSREEVAALTTKKDTNTIEALDRFRYIKKGDVDLKKLVRHAEGADDGNDPAFLVGQVIYVQGVDISDYIKGSVTVSKSNVSGHSTLTFTLDNSNDAFVWTDRNLSGPVFGTVAKRDFFINKEGQRQKYIIKDGVITDAFLQNEELKKKVFQYKFEATQQVTITVNGETKTSTEKVNPMSVDAHGNVIFPRFDLAPNRCIFSRMDPIRMWSLYPYKIGGRSEQLWIPEFAGFIETVSIEDDEVLGTSTITIECADSRQAVMTRMRISSSVSSSLANPLDLVGHRPVSFYDEGENGTNAISPEQAEIQKKRQADVQNPLQGGLTFFSPVNKNLLFYDDVINSPFGTTTPPNQNLEETMKTLMVFNPGALERGRARRGINNIEFGGTFSFPYQLGNDGFTVNFLQQYHKFCLFGPKGRPWTREEVDEVGRETTTTGKFWPLNARLWILRPMDKTGPANLADLSTVNIQLSHQAEWTSRLEAIRNIIESLDYQMYVSGTGDIHVEFPFADFRPEDFGEFKEVFSFKKAVVSLGYSDEAEEPVAGLTVTTGFGAAVPPQPDIVTANYASIFAFSPYIAARYGMNVSQAVSYPFLNLKQKGVAQQRAAIEMQKANARCHTMNMTASYRPFLLPNRPVQHVRRSRIGNTVTVDTTFEIGANAKASTSVGLEHVRAWTGGYMGEELKVTQAQDETLKKTDSRPSELDKTSPLTGNESPAELLERQVYVNVMGGVNLPTSARREWSVDAPITHDGGVFLLDLEKLKQPQTPEPVKEVVAGTPPTGLLPLKDEWVREIADMLFKTRVSTPEGTKRLASKAMVNSYVDLLNPALEAADISSLHQLSLFLCQTLCESGNYVLLLEQPDEETRKKYASGKTVVDKKLVYIGRGFIQLSGPKNYEKASHDPKVIEAVQSIGASGSIFENPRLVEKPPVAVATTIWFWLENNLKNAETVDAATLIINGSKAKESTKIIRRKAYEIAKEVLSKQQKA